ncbi:XRE family transcriptional regulator [Prevotella bivia]|uniref:XRE family transcriptional regulator n=1 Tax=Prevotella bivia TaxID=28125 RepID=UPI0028894A7E|nr:XRE family transcriptional regulator [Prevotella bivia]
MSQKELSVTSGAPLSSIQCFEHTSEVSLSSFAKIVRTLDYAKELMEVISKPKYQSIEEMVRINKNKRRKRGTNEKF